MFKYETHLHTKPASLCASATAKEQLEHYKSLGYDGVFITNHFYDFNVNNDDEYIEMLNRFYNDYELGVVIGNDIGIKVFSGVEITYCGTDFLIYGLNKEWFAAHNDIYNMDIKTKLELFRDNGALVIQAHPFREAGYIDHIRLFPRSVHGVEVFNACRNELENSMAKLYADKYGLIHFSGSDNHSGSKQNRYGGMQSNVPIVSVEDFIDKVYNGTLSIICE